MKKEFINSRMFELEKILEYKFNDIDNLSNAMNSKRIKVENEGKNHHEWFNDALATVGDGILKVVLSDYFYKKGYSKGKITQEKKQLENNTILYNIANQENIISYAYNEEYFCKDNPPQHKQVSNSKHNQYIEAIIGAIYYDGGYEKVQEWIINWLLPKLEKSFSLIKENAKSNILYNIDKLQITKLGIERIRENVNLQNEDILEWSKNKICSDDSVVEKENKNYYIKVDNYIITVNASSYTIITVHKTK